MAKVQNFFQNPFNAAFEGVKDAAKIEAGTRTAKQANELFKDKPFAVENKTIYTIAQTIAYIANLVSFSTAFFALKNVLTHTAGAFVASLGALLLCGLIELLKNAVWKVNVKQVLRYKKYSPLWGCTLLFLSLLSIGASGYGAYILPSEITPPPPLSYTQNDSLVINELANLNAQIANQDKLMLETSAKAVPNAQGRVSSTYKILQAAQTAQKDSLNAQKRALNAKLERIDTERRERDKNALIAHQNSLTSTQIACLVVALVFEALYILCLVYCFYFLFRVYVDSGAIGTTPPPPTNPTNIPQINNPNQPHQPQQIGFKFYTNNQQNPPTNPHLTNQPNIDTNGFTTVLKPFADGLVSEENGIKFVYHNGKKYTKADVQNNVWAFRSKVKTHQQNPPKFQRYKEHLERWEMYLNSLTY